jgi:hypothetical protein
MWPNLEGNLKTPEPATWANALQAAFSGLVICVMILVAFAAHG